MTVESTFVLRSEPAGAEWLDGEVATLVRSLVVAFDTLRGRCGLPPCSLAVVVAEDLAAVVRGLQGQVIGVESLDDYSVERIGGVVAGKTMYRDAAHKDCVVVLDSGLFRSQAPEARVAAVQVSAHELAHGLVGQLRAAGEPPMPPAFLPWETSRWLARYAFEEHVADVIAEVFLGTFGTATLPDGTSHPLTSTDWASSIEPFVTAAADTFENIVTTIHAYRVGQTDLESMWLNVQANTSDALIALAHAQAEQDHSGADALSVATQLARPPATLWEEMRGCLGVAILDGADQFVVHEQQAIDRGGAAVIAFWRRLGLE